MVLWCISNEKTPHMSGPMKVSSSLFKDNLYKFVHFDKTIYNVLLFE